MLTIRFCLNLPVPTAAEFTNSAPAAAARPFDPHLPYGLLARPVVTPSSTFTSWRPPRTLAFDFPCPLRACPAILPSTQLFHYHTLAGFVHRGSVVCVLATLSPVFTSSQLICSCLWMLVFVFRLLPVQFLRHDPLQFY